MALVHADDLVAQRLPLLGEAHAHRAAVMRRALLHQVVVLDHLLDVVGDVRAQVAAAQRQLADGHLEIADVEQDHGLHVVDVVHALGVELELDHFQELAVQALDERDHVKISGLHATPGWKGSAHMHATRNKGMSRGLINPLSEFGPCFGSLTVDRVAGAGTWPKNPSRPGRNWPASGRARPPPRPRGWRPPRPVPPAAPA